VATSPAQASSAAAPRLRRALALWNLLIIGITIIQPTARMGIFGVIINFTLLVANIGSDMGAQLAAGRLLYGMGRGDALPSRFFGAIEPKRRIPRNNIIAVGRFALVGASLRLRDTMWSALRFT